MPKKLSRSRSLCRGTVSGMRIYFGFTMAGDRSSLEAARRMVAVLEQMGHEVLTRHLVEEGALEMDRRITPQEVYERDMAWLAQADLLLAEVSGSSYGLGFEVGYVLGASTRRVAVFYHSDRAQSISRMITGCTHPRCDLVPYRDPAEVVAWLRAHLGSEH